MPPLVSVIIPTLNRPQLLKRAIASVLSQSFADFEVLVIDDSSTGDASSVVRSFNDPRIHYTKNQQKGANAARNYGIQLSKDSLIAFLDDDDEWLPNKLRKQVDLLDRSDGSFGAVFSSWRYSDPAKKFSKIVRVPERMDLKEAIMNVRPIGTTSTAMVKKEVFEKVGGFDEAFPALQDWEMWLRISGKYRFAAVPEVLVNHNVQKNSITSNHPRVIRAHLMLMKKYPDIAKSRQFLAHYYSISGNVLCENGFMSQGRRYLIHSFRLIQNPYTFLKFLLSIPGKGAYNRGFSGFSGTALSRLMGRMIAKVGRSLVKT
jgi:glycosyltransferase involved in cell wall biosynthesis